MSQFCSPVYNIKRVPVDKIQANSYNPNHVAPPEMKLLYKSILSAEIGRASCRERV